MPLVVPGVMTGGANAVGDSKEAWMSKLLGKKLTDGASDETSFAKSDLPKHQVIEDGALATQEHDKDRLSIYLGPDGTIMNVEKK